MDKGRMEGFAKNFATGFNFISLEQLPNDISIQEAFLLGLMSAEQVVLFMNREALVEIIQEFRKEGDYADYILGVIEDCE